LGASEFPDPDSLALWICTEAHQPSMGAKGWQPLERRRRKGQEVSLHWATVSLLRMYWDCWYLGMKCHRTPIAVAHQVPVRLPDAQIFTCRCKALQPKKESNILTCVLII